jgi:hypothetical protein
MKCNCSMHGFCENELCEYREYPQYKSIVDACSQKYGSPIGSGRHRITFESKRTVIKVPLNIGGMRANTSEYEQYFAFAFENRPIGKFAGVPEAAPARCRLIYLYNTPVIVMEKLDVQRYADRPVWSCYFDCAQVAMSKKGIWKAFDFSIN